MGNKLHKNSLCVSCLMPRLAETFRVDKSDTCRPKLVHIRRIMVSMTVVMILIFTEWLVLEDLAFLASQIHAT